MMFKYKFKITEVTFCMSLRKYHDVTLAVNAAAAYTPCLRPHRKLILTAILLKISQINLQIMYFQKKERLSILIKSTLRALFA